MERKQFTVGEALRWGFKTFYSQLKFFLLLGIVYVGAIVGVSVLFTLCANLLVLTKPGNIIWARFIPIIFSLASHFIMLWLQLGFIKIMLDIYDYGKAEIKTLISQAPLLFRALFANLLFGLSVGLGMVCLIIPGLYLACRYLFMICVLVDKDSGVIDAFKESARLSSGVRWRILGLLSVVMLLVFIPFLFVPAVLALTYAYRKQQEYTAQLPIVQ